MTLDIIFRGQDVAKTLNLDRYPLLWGSQSSGEPEQRTYLPSPSEECVNVEDEDLRDKYVKCFPWIAAHWDHRNVMADSRSSVVSQTDQPLFVGCRRSRAGLLWLRPPRLAKPRCPLIRYTEIKELTDHDLERRSRFLRPVHGGGAFPPWCTQSEASTVPDQSYTSDASRQSSGQSSSHLVR